MKAARLAGEVLVPGGLEDIIRGFVWERFLWSRRETRRSVSWIEASHSIPGNGPHQRREGSDGLDLCSAGCLLHGGPGDGFGHPCGRCLVGVSALASSSVPFEDGWRTFRKSWIKVLLLHGVTRSQSAGRHFSLFGRLPVRQQQPVALQLPRGNDSYLHFCWVNNIKFVHESAHELNLLFQRCCVMLFSHWGKLQMLQEKKKKPWRKSDEIVLCSDDSQKRLWPTSRRNRLIK